MNKQERCKNVFKQDAVVQVVDRGYAVSEAAKQLLNSTTGPKGEADILCSGFHYNTNKEWVQWSPPL